MYKQIYISRPDLLVNPNIDNSAALVSGDKYYTGIADSMAMINWTNILSDQPLALGQTAYFNITNIVNSIPLNIKCDYNQLYSIIIMHLKPTNANTMKLSVDLQPNNTTYTNSFKQASLRTSYTNQGKEYNPLNATVQQGITNTLDLASTRNSFHFDDVDGSTVPPFIHQIELFTGNNINPKIATHFGAGGSGPGPAGSALIVGVNKSVCIWDDITTPYKSLGTVIMNNGLTLNTAVPPVLTNATINCEFKILVKRIF